MGLLLQRDDNRSELQSKVATELQDKLRQTGSQEDTPQPEPKFMENQHKTRPAGIIIGALIIVFAILMVYMLIMNQN